MRILIGVVFGIAIFSCSEPFSFDSNSEAIQVVDGKVSTLDGGTYVNIYQLNGNIQSPLLNLNVRVISGSGESILFRYDRSVGYYVPNDISFRGIEGETYQLIVDGDNIFIESSLDSIRTVPEFTLFEEDTVVRRLTSLNIVDEVDATAATISIPQVNQDELFLKAEFGYSYVDFFTEETVFVKDSSDYVLFTNQVERDFPDTVRIPVGLTTTTRWFFFNRNDFCDSASLETDFVAENCLPGCCQFFEDWPAEFSIKLESLSPDAFEYWDNVRQLSNNDGLIFDVFPFPIQGNVTCVDCPIDVVGLFRAVAEDEKILPVVL